MSNRHLERGSVTAMTAFMLLALLAIAGFTFDVGMLFLERRHAQHVADLSALAAVSTSVETVNARSGEGKSVLVFAEARDAACDVVQAHPQISACVAIDCSGALCVPLDRLPTSTPGSTTTGQATVVINTTTDVTAVQFDVKVSKTILALFSVNQDLYYRVNASAAGDLEDVSHLVPR